MENFCEIAYTIYQNVYQKIIDHQVVNEGRECVERLYNLTDSFARKKRVGILIESDGDWNKLKDIYGETLNQGDDVYLLPVPFYERDYKGNVTVEHYEGACFPEDIRILDYNANYEINGFDVYCIQIYLIMLISMQPFIRFSIQKIYKRLLNKLFISIFWNWMILKMLIKVCLNSIRIYDETVFAQFDIWLEDAKRYIEIRDAIELTKEDIEAYDVFYGDQGYLASQMIREKRLVMIQEIAGQTRVTYKLLSALFVANSLQHEV